MYSNRQSSLKSRIVGRGITIVDPCRIYPFYLSHMYLKGQCPEIFDFGFFHEWVSPKLLSIPFGPFRSSPRILEKNRNDPTFRGLGEDDSWKNPEAKSLLPLSLYLFLACTRYDGPSCLLDTFISHVLCFLTDCGLNQHTAKTLYSYNHPKMCLAP